MSKTTDAPLTQLRLPMTCAVCMSPAASTYPLEKIFTFGRRSYTVKINVPMCEQHFAVASYKGPVERLVGTLGVIIGIVAGALTTVGLLVYWQRSGEPNLLLNVFSGGALGVGVFLILWALISLVIAPFFADQASKEARNAVRITHYWPSNQYVRLRFENENLADLVQKAN